MMERGKDARDELHHVPPDPDLVKTYWHWYYEVIMWPTAPKRFLSFWAKVEASALLELWCTHPSFERKWLHVLFFHLGHMWNEGRGRVDLRDDVLQRVCVLDLIVQGLLPPMDATGRRPADHWEWSLNVLKEFFPEQCADPRWKRSELIRRAETYLEQQRPSGSMYAHFLAVLKRSEALISEEYRRDIRAHLSH